jgi:NarL family two-component system response regulator LiaR
MPHKDGLQAIREILQKHPAARILVITSFVEDEKALAALEAGALGYLIKDSSADELLQALRAAHQGEAHLHPALARKLVRRLNQASGRSRAAPTAPDSLTGREMNILQFIVQGLSNRDIAGRLYLSERTVDAHVSSILKKLHLANRTQAAMYALQNGLAKDIPAYPM